MTSPPTPRPSRRLAGLRTLGAFGVVGSVAFVLNVGLFQVLYAGLGAGAVSAKVVSTLVAMTVAFFGHRHWAFADRARTGLRREYVLFAGVNAATLLLGVAIVATVRYPLGQEGVLVLQAANVASIALGTVVRYLCYRRWVFPREVPAGTADTWPAATRQTA